MALVSWAAARRATRHLFINTLLCIFCPSEIRSCPQKSSHVNIYIYIYQSWENKMNLCCITSTLFHWGDRLRLNSFLWWPIGKIALKIFNTLFIGSHSTVYFRIIQPWSEQMKKAVATIRFQQQLVLFPTPKHPKMFWSPPPPLLDVSCCTTDHRWWTHRSTVRASVWECAWEFCLNIH